ASQMGKSARERVLPLFSAEQMVAQIDELYERLLIMKGVRSPNLRLRLKSQAQNWKSPQGDSLTTGCESPSGDFHLCA
ncbi:MAG: glycosyltransferase, partial [bacterium]